MTIISYSRTGNNQALATSLAKKLSAKHIPLTKPKSISGLSLFFDILFKRIPKVEPRPNNVLKDVAKDELILLVGPVWMGQVSTPLRAYLTELSQIPNKYGFISLSGGANGPNPELENELKTRVGRKPTVLINEYLADLMDLPMKPTVNDTMKYKATDEDITQVTKSIIKKIKSVLKK